MHLSKLDPTHREPAARRLRLSLFPLAASLLLMAGTTPAAAEGLAVGARIGTPGLGIEVTQSLTDQVNLRAGLNNYGYTRTGTQNEVDYTAELKLRSYSALLDLHPGGGAFRLTGGFFYDKNRVEGLATSTTTIEVNNTVYRAADIAPLTGSVSLERKIAPYLGLGVGNAVGRGKRLSLALDLGVVFQGYPSVALQAQGPLASDAGFQADLAQLQRDVNDDLRKSYFKYYPVVSLGLAYQF